MHPTQVAQSARLTTSAALVALMLSLGAWLIAAPKASASAAQCPGNAVCVWSENADKGEFRYWREWEPGCHNHENLPYIRSVWNDTGVTIRIGGRGTLAHGESWEAGSGNPLTGEICWSWP